MIWTNVKANETKIIECEFDLIVGSKENLSSQRRFPVRPISAKVPGHYASYQNSESANGPIAFDVS